MFQKLSLKLKIFNCFQIVFSFSFFFKCVYFLIANDFVIFNHPFAYKIKKQLCLTSYSARLLISEPRTWISTENHKFSHFDNGFYRALFIGSERNIPPFTPNPPFTIHPSSIRWMNDGWIEVWRWKMVKYSNGYSFF